MSEKSFCPDCGGAEAPHLIARSTVLLGFIVEIFTKPFVSVERRLAAFFMPSLETAFIVFFKLLAFFRVATITQKPRKEDTMRTICLWEAAEKRGIVMRGVLIFNRPTNIFFASFGGEAAVFEGLPRPNGSAAESLNWMDDKGIMKKKFKAAGIPVAKGGVRFTYRGAVKLFNSLPHPVIVKPNVGSRSRHTTTHIMTEDKLRKAVCSAKALSPWVMVEQELAGFVFRVVLIGGKVVGVLRREPPFVVGDGLSSVRDLVEAENKNFNRHNGIFHEIALDADAEEELKRQDLSWMAVPAKARMVTLNQKVGRSQGGTNTDVTDNVHPENTALFEKIGRVLADPLVGIDFIIADIARSWREQMPCGAIECNSLPFLDLHAFPFRGEKRNLSDKLWDAVFPKSKI